MLHSPMIPREIHKKIRQIEIRTNRLMNQRLVNPSFQSPAQPGGVSASVPDSENLNFLMLSIDNEINRVRPGIWHFGFAGVASLFRKTKWLFRNSGNHFIHFESKSNAQSLALGFIPGNSFPKFKGGFGVVDDSKAHFLYFASISSRSCSHGTPRPGFFRASS